VEHATHDQFLVLPNNGRGTPVESGVVQVAC